MQYSRFILLFACIIVSILGCKESQINEESGLEQNVSIEKNEDLFFHYSIWHAFVNKVFEGDLTVRELKENGDIGLGSYTLLDGELIMLDGIPYQVTEDGIVSIPNDDAEIVYANATFFEEDLAFDLKGDIDYEYLRNAINEKMPSANMFYAFKISGDFSFMKCGGLHRQEPPFEDGLDVLIPKRPIFERENFSGTMVGFFCPDFIGDINAAGYHLHFISEDKKFGGHVMEFKAKSLKVHMDEMNEYKFVLPDSDAYRQVGFDAEFQYQKK
jgi:acetolactate decarboxylase